MNGSTLATVVALNVLVSSIVVVVAFNVWSPDPVAPIEEERSSDRGASAGVAELRSDLDRLEVRVHAAEGNLVEVSDLRAELERLEDRISSGGVATAEVAAGGEPDDPELTPEEARRARMQEMMAGMIEQGARRAGRRILERIVADDEEAREEFGQRARRDAQRLARRLDLDEQRAAQLEAAFLEVDQRIREDLKRRIEAKGIDNVTYEDVGPAMDDSFEQRERAAQNVLTPTEMTTYKQEQKQQKTQIDTMMKAAFPPASESEGR